MALISVTYGAPPAFNVRAVKAGDAAEMVTRLTQEAAAAISAGDSTLEDFQLTGCGSGPQWQAWLVTGNTNGLPIHVALASLVFVAAVAGNPAEATLRLKQKLAAISPTPTVIFKVVAAGAGDGPTYMAVALAFIAPS